METGTRLGPIVIQQVVGQGGMGTVYLGFHEDLAINVAVKIVNPSVSQQPELLGRFALEARALARIDHPNVVRVLNFVSDHTPPYLVQEYVEGKTLRTYLQELGTLGSQEAIRVVLDVALALRAAHRIGIVHRDVKPD